jgi:hypothetical protein
MLLSERGWLLSLASFSHKIRQGLGLDHHLGHVGYVEPHKPKCLVADPSRGELVPNNFSKPK